METLKQHSDASTNTAKSRPRVRYPLRSAIRKAKGVKPSSAEKSTPPEKSTPQSAPKPTLPSAPKRITSTLSKSESSLTPSSKEKSAPSRHSVPAKPAASPRPRSVKVTPKYESKKSRPTNVQRNESPVSDGPKPAASPLPRPTRRLSTGKVTPPTENRNNQSAGKVTPSENRNNQSTNGQLKNESPVSNAPKRTIRKKFSVLSSTSYWLSQIKISESAAKHSISLGFFQLALESGCEPLQRMRDELKSYAGRHNLVELRESMKQVVTNYDISEDPDKVQPEEASLVLESRKKRSVQRCSPTNKKAVSRNSTRSKSIVDVVGGNVQKISEAPAVEVPKKDIPALEVPKKETRALEVPKDIPALEVPKKETPALEVSKKETPALEVIKKENVNTTGNEEENPACVKDPVEDPSYVETEQEDKENKDTQTQQPEEIIITAVV